MQDPQFKSIFIATWQGKDYPVVFLLDYVQGIVSFQDTAYHPSEIHSRPMSEVVLTLTP